MNEHPLRLLHPRSNLFSGSLTIAPCQANLAGHKRSGSTETYTAYDPDYLKDAAKALDKLVRATAHKAEVRGYSDRKEIQRDVWWAHKGSNLGPLPCEGNALPLSYAPGNFGQK